MPIKKYTISQIGNGYKHFNPIIPSQFRLLITGPSGCGKTNLILAFIYDILRFDKLYLVSKSLQEDDYIDLKENFELFENFDIIDIMKFMKKDKDEFLKLYSKFGKEAFFFDNLEDMIDVNDLDKEYRNLIIFDDCCLEKDQSIIGEYFIKGRKSNADIIYITQKYHTSPKIVREQCNYFIFFQMSPKDMKNVLNEVDGIGEKFENLKLDNHDFFEIDKTKKDDNRYRMNFKKI
jgi:nucleoside-triphosphatase THEP1